MFIHNGSGWEFFFQRKWNTKTNQIYGAHKVWWNTFTNQCLHSPCQSPLNPMTDCSTGKDIQYVQLRHGSYMGLTVPKPIVVIVLKIHCPNSCHWCLKWFCFLLVFNQPQFLLYKCYLFIYFINHKSIHSINTLTLSLLLLSLLLISSSSLSLSLLSSLSFFIHKMIAYEITPTLNFPLNLHI